MGSILTLLFLAAVVGIIKPWIKPLNRKHFGLAAFILFISIGAFAANENGGSSKKAPEPAPSASETVEAVKDPLVESKWIYQDEKDEMRGTSSRLAQITSENSVDFGFPYGESSAKIWIRGHGKKLDVAFAVDKGQVLCHSFANSYVTIKFDGGPVERYSCTSASDGSSETAFILNEAKVVARLKKASKVIIEAEFFQNGRRQFTFEAAGLKWD